MFCSGSLDRITRRELVIGGAVAATGCSRPKSALVSPVAIVRAPAYDQALYATTRRMLAELQLKVRGKHVLVKPNLVEFDSTNVINTHPLVVHAIVESIRSMGAATVRIAEGPGHRRTTLAMAEEAGYFSTIPDFEQLFTDLNEDEVSLVTLPAKASKLGSLYLPRTALRADLLISVPKMKTHHWVGATLSMKNLFGVVPGAVYGWPKNILHWAGIDESIVDLHSAFARHFAVVDGIDGMEGNGPIQGARKHVGVLVAGGDMVAVDATCCRIMGIDASRIKYLAKAASRGQLSEAFVPQRGERILSVRKPFRILPQWQHIVES